MEEKLHFDNLNLNERVYLHLRDKIVNSELKPGSKIEYEQLIAELGVSRTPLRDALNRLQLDNLIEVKPRSGTYVSIPRSKDIQEIYDVRKPLECVAVELAAPHVSKEVYTALLEEADHAEADLEKGSADTFFQSDRNLHNTFIQHSNNNRLIMIMNSLEVQIKWFGVIMTVNFDRPLQAIGMHRKIIKAMYNNQIDNAKELMGRHIDEVRQDIFHDFLQREQAGREV
ncbi:GntR family transcriptional regulator [Peribacillus cavernae]|uniref:GntR family transcriptional regulator n=1 Tax=Peribacillus cavernae TaxID=1674310 RepID=A0A433HWP1_9BACI|nr:GntR family transcriptional regulator [Peribacillus cavernae]MDQ0218143.1 DNA-binding GntR family transcriptional regulator [Peribacillus cavernae]RUQ32705.1 GntR family transcriptional regulator [Peribacillus cavernae]